MLSQHRDRLFRGSHPNAPDSTPVTSPFRDPVHDAIAEAREQLEADVLEMLGMSAALYPALGQILAKGGVTEELVVRELSYLSARMALEAEAFYDAARIRAEIARARIREALELLSTITDGRNAILRWSPKTRRPKPRIEELDELLRRIKRARFARSEVTETVRSDLVAQARAA